jgi:hypothetical protein
MIFINHVVYTQPFLFFFGGTSDAHLTLHSFFPPSSYEPKKEYMICFSILVATVDVIGNKERLWIGRLFIIDLSKHTLSLINK